MTGVVFNARNMWLVLKTDLLNPANFQGSGVFRLTVNYEPSFFKCENCLFCLEFKMSLLYIISNQNFIRLFLILKVNC